MYRPSLTYSRGLLTLAACLELHGYKVKYLIYSDPNDRDKIVPAARHADVVGITVLTPTFPIANELCNIIKDINPNTSIILGGPHISAVKHRSLEECPNADYAMIGECEERLPRLLANIESPEVVDGTLFRNGKDIFLSSPIRPSAQEIAPPMPAYHLLSRPLSEYAHNIKTLRGCPFACSFCYERRSSVSQTTISDVVDEIDFLQTYLPKQTLVHFSDAIFNLNADRTNQILERIKHQRTGLYFSFDTRVDLINRDITKSLTDSGFVYFRMGFENGNDLILKESNKATTSNIQASACETIRSVSSNAAIHAYMITGLPGTTRSSFSFDRDYTQMLIKKDLVDIVGNKIMVPYPGTPYHDNAANFGILIDTNNWGKYDRRSVPVFHYQSLSARTIYAGYLLQELSLVSAYIARMQKQDVELVSLDQIDTGLDYLYVCYAAPNLKQ